ncbi:MAG: hypothetical protein V2B19_17765 [Pseudomonadota bacterium]
MKKKSLIYLLAVMALLCVSSVSFAGEVSQGKCTAYDKEKKTVTLDEYNLNFSKANPYGEPTGVISVFDVSSAQIGLQPEPGDILRLAYKVDGTKKTCVKLMNVSKQDLRKK